jgi:hypothetical protein
MQAVTVQELNWELNLHPNHVSLEWRQAQHERALAQRLAPPSPREHALAGCARGALVPALLVQPHVDGDEDCDDHAPGHVDVKFSRQAFIASVNAGIAGGKINPKKQVAVQFLSGTHLIGRDNVTVK